MMRIRLLSFFTVFAFMSIPSNSAAETVLESKQFDAKRLDFHVGDSRAFIVLPSVPSPDGSKPWVWYAPTFIGALPDDSHTWMAKQLLDVGFAICGVDVGES